MKRQEKLYLGIDGGGSKCKVLLANEQGQALATGMSGPANPNQGLDLAINSIMDATEQALHQAGFASSMVDQLVVGAGLAGVNLPKYRAMLDQWDHPFAQFHITTDLQIACLGAHDGEDGAVIIAGTGSIGMAHVDGNSHELGGYGFSVGDQGSGAWMGVTAIKQTLQAMDGLLPRTELVDQVLEFTQCRTAQELAQQMANLKPSAYAKLAPLVIERAAAKDTLALDIVLNGADYISRLARKLLTYNPPRLSMIGGLAPRIQSWLDEDVRVRVEPAKQPPEIGAILFAQQQALVSEKA
ncbi:BadF/BadG/BcrA/BcrD ATPase family protein [Bowmanella denitrificans]|uniref:BadF/BadG/BcrA/BcrD ATPase family protein n=1 Tax=Bowmanella denitrificans TaxID=366582 RepID=A0ABP3GJQ4_9ALTE|nr:BadF/BadG/BcrA/BcrD ATPase family protein [Bowmanella denitrificans]